MRKIISFFSLLFLVGNFRANPGQYCYCEETNWSIFF